MHNWDMLSTESTNYEQIWRMSGSLPNDMEHKIKIKSESNPTSPHSMASEESYDRMETADNIYHNDAIHALMHRTNAPFAFDPLTPPGNPSLFSMRPGTNINCPTTPLNHFSVSELAFNSVAITPPSQTPPADHTPPKSPKSPKSRSDTSEKDCNDIDNSSVSGDESKSMYSESLYQDIAKPKYNSHGKMKVHKCKHCDYVGTTKQDFWIHLGTHIKPERQIRCPVCPFITEFKHHFEYHSRNHQGKKPFKCPECTYTCVNKSMLNSHMKSHSDVFQYRCDDCVYATKYVHSLKLHLRKYGHRVATPLETEGCLDASSIDVYGKRRGPKKRSSKSKRAAQQQKSVESSPSTLTLPVTLASPSMDQLPQTLSPHTLASPQKQQQPSAPHLQSLFTSQILHTNPNLLSYYLNTMKAQMLAQFAQHNKSVDDDDDDDNDEMPMTGSDRLDTSMENDIEIQPESPTSSMPTTSINGSLLNKINSTIDEHRMSGQEHEAERQSDKTAKLDATTPDTSKLYHCKFCGIYYEDAIIHTIHMAHHGFNDKFMCNKCGEQCNDRVSFNMHIAQMQHP